MLRSIGLASLGTGFIFLLTTLGAATVFLFRSKPREGSERGLLGFAAGVMTAASVWSLLLPAIEQAEKQKHLPSWLPSAAGFLFGVLFLAAMDALIPRLRKRKQSDSDRTGGLLMTAITLHNIPEGMAVGLAFALAADGESLVTAWALALGIGIQNFPEGAAISLPLHRAGKSRTKAFFAGVLSGIVEPLFGIASVLVAATVSQMMPWLLSFAAGAMLYVVVEELVPEAHSRSGTAGYVVGFLVMMILDVALG